LPIEAVLCKARPCAPTVPLNRHLLLGGGLFGVAIGLSRQVVAQKHALASHAAIILSLEAVFAAVAGAWLLGEALQLRGYCGCALMLAGMLLAQLWPKKPCQLPTETAANAGAGRRPDQPRAAP
jgi:drug/metabolite transporter (DMT)-like permease